MMTRIKLLALISASAFTIAALSACEQQSGEEPPAGGMDQQQQDPGMGEDPGMGQDPGQTPPPQDQ